MFHRRMILAVSTASARNRSDRIHEASLEILERIGIRVYLPEAIALFREAGAEVEDGNLVRIPSATRGVGAEDCRQAGDAI